MLLGQGAWCRVSQCLAQEVLNSKTSMESLVEPYIHKHFISLREISSIYIYLIVCHVLDIIGTRIWQGLMIVGEKKTWHYQLFVLLPSLYRYAVCGCMMPLLCWSSVNEPCQESTSFATSLVLFPHVYHYRDSGH